MRMRIEPKSTCGVGLVLIFVWFVRCGQLPGFAVEAEARPIAPLLGRTEASIALRRYLLAGLPTVTPTVAAPTGIPVPSVVGQSGASAVAALRRAGLKSRRQEEATDTAPAGQVVGTSPAAGAMVDKGSAVTVIIAAPVRVAVPRVAGQTVAAATAALGRAGLKWQRREQPSEQGSPGTVIGTSPAAGQSVGKGAIVTLVVATAAPRPPALQTPPILPNRAAAVVPQSVVPQTAASSTRIFAPTPAAPQTPPPVPEPAPAVLTGDALIGHLYDNAHR